MTGRPREARETCLWLARRAAFDPGLLQRLRRVFGSMDEVVAQPTGRLARHARRPPAGVPAPAADDVTWRDPSDDLTRAIVTWVDAEYPERLREVFDAPPALFVAGAGWRRALAALSGPAVAIVGARGPSPYGLEMTALLAGDLARRGVSIVSGLALGIDAAAHREALQALPATGGATVAAVLGCGAVVVHPRANRDLFALVRHAGVIVSEYGWDLPGLAWRFPARNRIIAGLADAVVIVEGGARSGSLHTAGYMLELGREVLAVPGEAGRRLSAGPHLLLREGARLCESAADVCEAIGLSRTAFGARGVVAGEARTGDCRHGGDHGSDGQTASAAGGLSVDARAGPNSLEERVLERLGAGRHTVDQLVRGLGETIPAVVAAVTMLEVEGLVQAESGGVFRLVKAPVMPRRSRVGAASEQEAVPGPAKQQA